MNRRTVHLIAGLVVAAAVVAVPQAALAASDSVQVSTDGTTYTATNVLPLFSNALRIVPGDAHTTAVWVRNDGPTAARLRIDLIAPQAESSALAAAVTLAATPSGRPAEPVSFAEGIGNGACTVLRNDQVLQPGQSVRLDVRAEMFAAIAGTTAASEELSFELGASLFDADTVTAQPVGSSCLAAPAPPTSSGAGDGTLAHTGGAFPLAVAAWGTAGLIAGAVVFLGARRRRVVDDDSREL